MRISFKDLHVPARAPLSPGWLWLAFLVYVILLGIGCIRHEMWTDELHAWNLAKGSGSYGELLFNRRYEGHPPGWYTLLWLLSKLTHDVNYMQVLQWLTALATVFLLTFFSPIPSRSRVLIPFGYYFLWEYGVFSRNYNFAVLLAFCICMIIRREFRFQPVLYYLLLFLLSNFHLLGILLAISLHGYYLLLEKERGRPFRALAAHTALGALILLPAVWLSVPPGDGHGLPGRPAGYRLRTLYEMPVRAFLPIPAWWRVHFWNSHFLLALGDSPVVSATLLLPVALLLLFFAYRTLWDERKSRALFTINLLLNFLIGTFLVSLLTARYSGFIFIGFLVAWWLYAEEKPAADQWLQPMNLFFVLAIGGGLFAFWQDLRRPFSNDGRVKELLRAVPAGQTWVTDYWTFTPVVAYTDRPAYCVDMGKPLSFIVWGVDIPALQKDPNRYTHGLNRLFGEQGLHRVYLITHAPLPMLEGADGQLLANYTFSLVDSRTGSIDDGSDLYLFRIEPIFQGSPAASGNASGPFVRYLQE